MATTASAPIATRWWVPLVEGIFAIILSLLFFSNPVTTSVSFVFGLGFYWLLIGIVDLISIFQDRTAWGWKLFTGIIGVVAGFWIMSGIMGSGHPLGTAFVVGQSFTWVLGILGIVYGIIALFGAFRGGGLWAGVLGVIAIVFGFWILANPLAATLSLPLSLAWILLIGGIFLIVTAFRIRSAGA